MIADDQHRAETIAQHGWVYFIRSGDRFGPVKIGITRNPARRLAALQTANSEELQLLAVCPNWDGCFEQSLHETLSASRLQGEWFRRSADLVQAIEKFGEPYELLTQGGPL